MQPGTDNLWCVVNERDHLGPDLVPDFMARVQEGAFYGWPWYAIGANQDPAVEGKRRDLKDEVRVPEVLFQAHSSALSVAFYDREAFPAEYRGDAFVALHGSHSRPEMTGYKVVRVRMQDGKPTGEYEDFMTGFVLDDDTVWARPAGVAVTRDGALLVSDDANGTIFRVTYGKYLPRRSCRAGRRDAGAPQGVHAPRARAGEAEIQEDEAVEHRELPLVGQAPPRAARCAAPAARACPTHPHRWDPRRSAAAPRPSLRATAPPLPAAPPRAARTSPARF
jgi:hypothetical protein